MQRALFNAYPTVTVINIADVLETIQGVIGQITVVIRFLAAFSILSGAIILVSSIASTRFRRIREVVVLKTLGAKRRYIVAVFSIEFMVLGLLAGVVGMIFANLLAAILLHRLDVEFQWQWVAACSLSEPRCCWPRLPAGWPASASWVRSHYKCCARNKRSLLPARATRIDRDSSRFYYGLGKASFFPGFFLIHCPLVQW